MGSFVYTSGVSKHAQILPFVDTVLVLFHVLVELVC